MLSIFLSTMAVLISVSIIILAVTLGRGDSNASTLTALELVIKFIGIFFTCVIIGGLVGLVLKFAGV